MDSVSAEKIKDFHNQHRPKHSEQNSDTEARLTTIPFNFSIFFAEFGLHYLSSSMGIRVSKVVAHHEKLLTQ